MPGQRAFFKPLSKTPRHKPRLPPFRAPLRHTQSSRRREPFVYDASIFAEPPATVRVVPTPAWLPRKLRGYSNSLRGFVSHKPWAFVLTELHPPQEPPAGHTGHEQRGNARMLNTVQLLTTPTADTPGALLQLHFDYKRYLFGSFAEGTQRAMSQRKFGFHKTEDFFLSGPINWHNAGGLMGAILTYADVSATQKESLMEENKKRKAAGKKQAAVDSGKLNIHGSKNLAQLLATTRRFIFRKGLPLQPVEIRHDPRPAKTDGSPDWVDEYIKVWYMPIEAVVDESVKSPRKRSHDEMSGSAPEVTSSTMPEDTEEQNHEEVLRIVGEMFNSNWTMDALMETTLYKAKLPAKLFIRDGRGHIQVYKGPMPGDHGDVPDIPVLVRQPWPAAMYPRLPATQPARQSMCYIVKNHDRRGRFNPKEAEKYGVQKKEYRVLTDGGSVTGKDGIVVTPDMVLDPAIPGQGFLVLDVPSVSYVEPLLSRPELSNGEIMKGIEVAFWILGPGVSSDLRLEEFMQKTSSLRHIVCSPDTSPNMIALESPATQAYLLNCIDPDRFPMPDHSNLSTMLHTPTGTLPETVELGRTGKLIQFAPTYVHKDNLIIPFPNIKKLAATKQVPGVNELAEAARRKIQDPEFLKKIEEMESDIPNRDAEIITLGTGSALPSKYRNVSATLVRVPGYGSYLFDAGENTLGQLRRVFGKDLPSVLQELKVIWISHLHADHHLGTAGVIRAWHEETSKSNPSATLRIASHIHMMDWLREYAEIEDYGYNRLTFSEFDACDPAASRKDRILRPAVFTPAESASCGLERIDACYVEHCFGALATVFTWPSGLKVAYSGDCRPCNSFVKIGQGTTLLIHESTFDDELQGDAIAKKHSTMSEAIDVGRRMGARRIMLTHFSQRYQKIASVEDGPEGTRETKNDEVILTAFDHMRVKLGDFRKAQAFLPAIQKLLADAKEDE